MREAVVISQEIWGALIATYNLIRREMACAAFEAKCEPTELSFRSFHLIQHEMMWAARTPAFAKLPASSSDFANTSSCSSM